MSDKVEGTMILDGMLEGRSAALAPLESKLREWRAFVEKAGLRFTLEFEGNSFSLLAVNKPVEVRRVGERPAQVVVDALNEMLKVLPPEDRRGVFSTVRSVEYRKGEEAQTLYAVGPEGTMTSRERVVEAQTVAPEAPPSWREKLFVAVIGLGVAALLLALSTLFIDYRATWNRFVASMWPVNVEGLRVEAGRFEKYFVVADRKSASGGRSIVITLKRAADFPRTDADADRVVKAAGDSAVARLAAEAVVRGRVCVEFYDKDNKLITFTVVAIHSLRDRDTLDLDLPLPSERLAARIVFTD
jgi:hypothetical protein